MTLMSELEPRHLRTLCAIAEAGSLTKAAELLGVTQPALSAQLRAVEDIIGGKLFDRANAGSTPTELGDSVVALAGTLLDDLAEMTDHARQLAGAAGK